jgi:hypothetical protein
MSQTQSEVSDTAVTTFVSSQDQAVIVTLHHRNQIKTEIEQSFRNHQLRVVLSQDQAVIVTLHHQTHIIMMSQK